MPEAHLPRSKQRPKIGFVHRFDARDIRSWSGIFFFMAKALEDHVGEVVYLGPDKSAGTKFIVDNTARVNRFWQRLTGKFLATDKNRVLAKRLARFFEKRIEESPCDILFAPVAAVELAYLKTDLPVVYYSDITWNQIVDYYPEFSGVSSFGRAEGQLIETLAIRNATASAYPSEWAVNSACEDYGSGRKSTFKVSFGANLNDPPSRAAALNRTLDGPVNLLLVGVDWGRKGGAIALECLISLLEKGIDAHLTIMGCKPPEGVSHPRMHITPFLSKHDPEQRKQISQLFLQAHFMLLPTRADATPIVTCEASAFGLPTLATDTGGLQGSITRGVNGFLLPPEARGDAYAAKIVSVIANPAGYDDLVVSTRDEYENNLNWDAWGRSMRSIFEMALQRPIDPGFGEAFDESEATEEGNSASRHHDGSPELASSLASEVSRM
jgi:glycosyltransferase involved in cell wall biosynthesis